MRGSIAAAVLLSSDDRISIRKVNIAEFLAKELGERAPGVRFLPMDLTYILRAGEPVARDRHMAIFFANLIMSHVEAKRSGVMAAYRDGQFIVTVHIAFGL